MENYMTIEYIKEQFVRYKMEGCLAPVSQDWEDQEIVAFSWQLGHQNYLRCYYPDIEKKSFMYHASFIPLDQYVVELQQSCPKIYCIMELVDDKQNYCYVPDEFRTLFRSMVRFVSEVHDRGFCTTGFNRENLVVSSDSLQFYKLGFRRASFEFKQEDFDSIVTIIKQMLSEGLKHVMGPREEGINEVDDPLPCFLKEYMSDMDCFLNLMTAPSGNVEVIVNHVGIMSLRRLLRLIRNAFDGRHVIGVPTFEHVMESMESRENWVEILSKNKSFYWFLSTPGKMWFEEEFGDHVRHEDVMFKRAITNPMAKRNYELVEFLSKVIAYGFDASDVIDSVLDREYIAIVISNLFGAEVSSLQQALAYTVVEDDQSMHHGKSCLSLFEY